MEIKLRTLTPIWTGDAERKGEKLRETGIIGSLRWWCEALIRGLGGCACDPTSNSRCPDEDGNHCDACDLFGCTGWARKFRLEVKLGTAIPQVWIGTREKRKNKYLKQNVAGCMSDEAIILRFIPLREMTQNEWSLLNEVLKIIANYGALGAHISQGNGVIKIVENKLPHADKSPKRHQLKKEGISIKSPNLNDFFFYKFRLEFTRNISDLIEEDVFWSHAPDHNDRAFKDNRKEWKTLWEDYNFLPIAPHVRYALRHMESNRKKRHAIFGTGGKNAKGSRIFVSHGYKANDKSMEIRIWGYNIEESIQSKIKDKLKDKLKENLFSNEIYKKYLKCCTKLEEKTGKQILEELK